MTYRSPARYLALLALLAAAFAVYLVVHSGTAKDASPSASTTRTTTTTTTTRRTTTKRTYTVRPGDTLSGIAERTGVSLARLEELNPDVDVNTLNAGQRLKLRPSS